MGKNDVYSQRTSLLHIHTNLRKSEYFTHCRSPLPLSPELIVSWNSPIGWIGWIGGKTQKVACTADGERETLRTRRRKDNVMK